MGLRMKFAAAAWLFESCPAAERYRIHFGGHAPRL
jgi:hypothetical protein